MQYSKPHMTFDEQLDQLVERGLGVEDRIRAIENLENIGYYRLSGYWYSWKRITGKQGKEVIRADNFMPNHTLEEAVSIYSFDRKLRLLLLDALERIEVAFRVQVAYIVGLHGPLGYLDLENLGNNAKRSRSNSTKTNFEAFVERNNQLLRQSKEIFAEHVRKKYDGVPPIWIATELWDFGQLSSFYSIMAPSDQTAVANSFGIPKKQILVNWMQALNYLRNLCAHHCRIYRRTLVYKPNPTNMSHFSKLEHIRNIPIELSSKIYPLLCVSMFLMEQISPASRWPDALRSFVSSGSEDPATADLGAYGFPADWEAQAIWN
jgi:abortive infection bacteriophage resistance protein